MTRARALVFCMVGVLASALSAGAEPPRLVVVLVVDQMRNDYIDDYGSHWTGGLHRLAALGARFRNAAYPYLNTVTCAGHASIGTGTVPAVHGIVLNAWWDRESQKLVSCTDDPEHPDVGYAGVAATKGDSAKRLLVPTFAETLARSQGSKSQVVTFSLKARSAIMLAGHHSDVTAWFADPGWLTSSSVAGSLRPEIEGYLKDHPVENDRGKTWTKLLPEGDYKFTDEAIGEQPPGGTDGTFPHPLTKPGDKPADFYNRWEGSPFSDRYLGELGAAAVDRLKLGQGPAIDFLGVSFSALDHVGHQYGPRSHEIQDVLAQLDVTIGKLLDHLDRTVGKDRYVVALSADHGVAVIPEQARAEGKDAGRIVLDTVSKTATVVLVKALGPGRYVARAEYTYLYLQPGVMDRVTGTPGLLEKLVSALGGIEGMLTVFPGASLDPKAPPANDPIRRAAALNEFPDRSGDIVLVPKPGWIFVGDAAPDGTTHGTPHPYDVHVPVLFYGAGIRPGQYDDDAAPIDIAPTLARITGVALPTATGRVLESGLAPSGKSTH